MQLHMKLFWLGIAMVFACPGCLVLAVLLRLHHPWLFNLFAALSMLLLLPLSMMPAIVFVATAFRDPEAHP